MENVISARVHVAIPEENIISEEKKLPKASVYIKCKVSQEMLKNLKQEESKITLTELATKLT
jgi:flagellar biosynthesis/type III secretory pathway M-ring protein FliF/YscJ